MGNCKGSEMKCIVLTGLKYNFKNGKLENNRIEVQTDKGIIEILVSESEILTDFVKILKGKIKQNPIAKDATVETTTRFDKQAILLEECFCEISAKEQAKDLETERDELEADNETLERDAEDILIDAGYDLGDFEPQNEIPDDLRDALEENGVLDEYEDICDKFNINNMRIEEINKLLSSEEINLTENFCKQNPEVQSKLDDIIRSASFSALYTYFTACREKDFDFDYDNDTLKIMDLLSLEFCDVVNGKIDFANTEFYYQALKDMVYELYKSIPGEEYKED